MAKPLSGPFRVTHRPSFILRTHLSLGTASSGVKSLAVRVGEASLQAVAEAAEETILEEAKRLCPVDSGLLRDSLEVSVGKETGRLVPKTGGGRRKASLFGKIGGRLRNVFVFVGSRLAYFLWMERGTKPHRIGRSVPIRDKVTREIIWRKIVKHPGVKAFRFIQRAAEKEKERFWRVVRTKLTTLLVRRMK